MIIYIKIKKLQFRLLVFVFITLVGIFKADAQAVKCDTSAFAGNVTGNEEIAGFNSGDSSVSNKTDDSVELALLNSRTLYLDKEANRKALFHYLRSNKLRRTAHNKRVANRLYRRLANVFARMKIYPLAMGYYLRSVLTDTLQNGGAIVMGADSNINYQLSFKDTKVVKVLTLFPEVYMENGLDSLANSDANTLIEAANVNSEPVRYSNIISSYDDRKEAIAYAVIFHVKQPIAGSRKAFAGLGEVGHTFVTLIKYNIDSSFVSRSFGFYPEKDNILSATPLFPISTSVYKDDAHHDWDESVGKFISYRRFKKILLLIAKYNRKYYQLNSNNCTDFGLAVAKVAGVGLSNTSGHWPLGKGNNPANAGQSIMEGKLLNLDTQTKEGLFICTVPY